MKVTVEEFGAWPHKSITLLGMSGVGKTRIAQILRKHQWFHYSGDYRIGTRYLDEPILDNIKRQAMQVTFLRALLRSDSIFIRNNITVSNLSPVSSFLSKLGDPERGGLSLREFKRRQELHLRAEISAMRDVPAFIRKARDIYGYKHFVNDAGGSICELDDDDTFRTLDKYTLILYIKTSDTDERELVRRAEAAPKPLYYREAFLDAQLEVYLQEKDLPFVAMVEPDDFVRWVFPKLFRSRVPRYEKIAAEYGYTITMEELSEVKDEAGFLRLVEAAIARKG